MTQSLTDCLADYFSSIEKQYPYGVPKELALPRESTVSKPVFIAMQRNNSEHKLLEAAITKGMKQDVSSVEIVYLSEHDQILAEIRKKMPSCVILLGDAVREKASQSFKSISEHGLSNSDQLDFFCTYDLSDVLSDPAIKKMFWFDLQKIMSHLGIA